MTAAGPEKQDVQKLRERIAVARDVVVAVSEALPEGRHSSTRVVRAFALLIESLLEAD